jgi:hypothetical protein
LKFHHCIKFDLGFSNTVPYHSLFFAGGVDFWKALRDKENNACNKTTPGGSSFSIKNKGNDTQKVWDGS